MVSPIIPVGLVRRLQDFDDGGFDGAKIPFSFKSFLLAWFRALSVVGLFACGIAIFIAVDLGHSLFLEIGAMIGIIVALVCSYKFCGTASYDRAQSLGKHLGLSEEGKMLIEVAYGRMDPAELEKRLGDENAAPTPDTPKPASPMFDDAIEDDGDDNNPYRNF